MYGKPAAASCISRQEPAANMVKRLPYLQTDETGGTGELVAHAGG